MGELTWGPKPGVLRMFLEGLFPVYLVIILISLYITDITDILS